MSLNSKVKQCCPLNLYVPSAIKLVQANCTPRNKPSISDLSPPIAIKLEQRSSCFLIGHTLSLTRMHIKSWRISKYIHIRRAAHHIIAQPILKKTKCWHSVYQAFWSASSVSPCLMVCIFILTYYSIVSISNGNLCVY